MESELKVFKDIIENNKHKCIFVNKLSEKIYWLSKEDIDLLKNKITITFLYNDITSKYKDFGCTGDV